MNSKLFRPFARSLLLAVVFNLFAPAVAEDKIGAAKQVADSAEGKACKLCGG